MEIRKVPKRDIIITANASRKDLQEGDQEYKQIEASINSYGLVQPLVWNQRTKHLVGGHQRYKILVKKGYKEFEVSVVDLDLGQQKALTLALNKVQGLWEKKNLAVILDALVKIPDFNIESIGFNKTELSQIFDRYLSTSNEDDFDFEKAAESIVRPVTKRGDLIILEKHKLLCGDSFDPKDVALLMGDLKGNLLLTDPPYRVRYLSTQRPKKSRKWEPIYKDDLSQPEYEKWLRQILTNIEPHLLPGAPFYIWNGFAQFPHMMQTLEGLNFKISCVITWVKETFTISFGDYHQGGEFALYGWKCREKGRHPWYGGVDQSTVWQIRRDPTASYQHPTQKPTELFARAIRNSSQRDDIIVELFAGSGTSILSSESLDRRCFAMEIEPKYCDIIARRFIAYKGIDNVSEELRKKYITEASNE